MDIPFASTLLACVVMAAVLRDRRMIRAAVALFANWAVLSFAYMATGDQYNVPLNMSVDWVTIWLGFAPATQFPQVLMAFTFGIGMMFHADHLFKLCIGVPFEQLKAPYWWRFHYLAWGQAALMIGWVGHGGGRFLLRNFSRASGLSPVSAQRAVARDAVGRE